MRPQSGCFTASVEGIFSFSVPSSISSPRLLGDAGPFVLHRLAGGSVGGSSCAIDCAIEGAKGSAKEKPKSAVIARTLCMI
jgi:hypothetical protein